MIELAEAAAVVKVVADSFGLIDKVYDSWRKFTENRKVEKSEKTKYNERITSTNDNRVLVNSYYGETSKEVTIEELKNKLSPGDQRHIEALERRLEINVRTWDGIVGNIELETNLANKARYEQQLDDLKAKIGKDLAGI